MEQSGPISCLVWEPESGAILDEKYTLQIRYRKAPQNRMNALAHVFLLSILFPHPYLLISPTSLQS
jgi:hypothetical protein